MKRLITMVIMVLAVAVAMAQAPEKFTYQAVVRNASNALVTNTLVGEHPARERHGQWCLCRNADAEHERQRTHHAEYR